MAIYELTPTGILSLPTTTFAAAGINERADLQRVLRENIGVVAPGTLVIAEEFAEWDDSRRRIDLLAIDHDANLVVIELKRTEDGGHMELQAVRYAAMVSKMTFQKVVDVYARHLRSIGSDDDPESTLLDFLGWDEPNEEAFAQQTRIVLASAEFSKELTTAVIWLNEQGLDIRCVRLKPYKLDGRLIVDAQQIVPLPEAAEYQVKIREKEQREKESRRAREWDEEAFTKDLLTTAGSASVGVARELLRWITPRVTYIFWGQGEKHGSWMPVFKKNATKYQLWRTVSNGWLAVRFDLLRKKSPFDDPAVRREILDLLRSLPGVDLTDDYIDRRVRFRFDVLADPRAMESFKRAAQRMVDYAAATSDSTTDLAEQLEAAIATP